MRYFWENNAVYRAIMARFRENKTVFREIMIDDWEIAFNDGELECHHPVSEEICQSGCNYTE